MKWAIILLNENVELLSFLSQNMIGRQKPTQGLLVAPITVIASEIFGMQTAARKHAETMEKVAKKFSPADIYRSWPKNNSSTVSLAGMRHIGEARITPARSTNLPTKINLFPL